MRGEGGENRSQRRSEARSGEVAGGAYSTKTSSTVSWGEEAGFRESMQAGERVWSEGHGGGDGKQIKSGGKRGKDREIAGCSQIMHPVAGTALCCDS